MPNRTPLPHPAPRAVAAPGVAGILGVNGVTMLRRLTLLAFIGALVSTVASVDLHHLQWLDLRYMVVPLACIVSYGLLRAGRTQAAVRSMIWCVALYILGIAFVVQGVRTPGLIVLPVFCTIAAWLLGLRSAIALGALAITVIAFFAIAEPFGYKPPQMPRNTPTYAVVYIVAIACAILVAIGSTRGLEEELRRSQKLASDLQTQVQESRQSEERFAALFRANPVPSSTNDPDGRIIDVNDAWIAQYGVQREDAIGKTATEVGIWSNPAERKAVYLELAARGRVDAAPIYLQAPGGIRKPFLLYIAPVEFDGQRRLVTSMLDQTDRYAAEAAQDAIHHELEARVVERTAELSQTLETLKTAQNELVQSEKLASLGAMVAGISHELNTPIGNAVTVSSTLQSRIADLHTALTQGELRRSTLTDFVREAGEMSNLILRSTERAAAQIRSFKQVAVDRTSERRRSFDVRELVHDIVASIQPGIRASSVTIVQNVPAEIGSDSLPGPVGQVLTNLIQNAVLHAFVNLQTGTITINAETQGRGMDTQIVLKVQDNGVGMSDHVRRHAFDPFFTTRMGQGGSGLGLSVSHRLATMVLGGNLSVQSTPGSGSCFTFCWLQTLPEEPA